MSALASVSERVTVEVRTATLCRLVVCPALGWPLTCRLCSSLLRLAAVALLVLEEEESAFWCLVAIVETILPADYYSKTLTASQVRGRAGTWRPCRAEPLSCSCKSVNPRRAGSLPGLHSSTCTVGQSPFSGMRGGSGKLMA